MQNKDYYSKVIVGTMTWGSWGKKLTKNGMIDLLNHCLENGLSTFDHADIYGDYSTESDFGAALSESGVQRSALQLISKCGIQMTSRSSNRLKHYEYSKEYIIWSAEESLKKLKTDYLDLFLLHRPSPLLEPNEVADAIHRLLESGKIKQFGVSNFTPSQVAMLEKLIPVSANQVEFSLTQNEAMYNGVWDDCLAHGRIGMAWSPLGTVFRENNDSTKRIKKQLAILEEKYSADGSQLLLAWMLKHPIAPHPVIGTTTKDRITSSAKAAEIALDLQDWFVLLEASLGQEVP